MPRKDCILHQVETPAQKKGIKCNLTGVVVREPSENSKLSVQQLYSCSIQQQFELTQRFGGYLPSSSLLKETKLLLADGYLSIKELEWGNIDKQVPRIRTSNVHCYNVWHKQ